MRKHLLVSADCFQKIAKCFSDSEEVTTFINQMSDVIEELSFTERLRERTADPNVGAMLLLKQVCIFGMFCREHIDLLHQIISQIDYRELTEEEIEDLKED